jgi:heptaprenyl diphosphate synthase
MYLMARAFEHVASADRSVRAAIALAASRVARGQAREMTDLYREDVSVEEYLSRASDKTGALFELAARLGAVAGGCDSEAQAVLAAFGAHVGVAFQIADDLRDVIGGPALGREAGTDIREGVYTLPILIALIERRHGWERLRRAIRRARREKDGVAIASCREILTSNGALEAATAVLRQRIDAAKAIARVMGGDLGPSLTAFAADVAYGLDGVIRAVQ